MPVGVGTLALIGAAGLAMVARPEPRHGPGQQSAGAVSVPAAATAEMAGTEMTGTEVRKPVAPPSWMLRALQPAIFAKLSPVHQEFVQRRLEIAVAHPERPFPQACFADGTAPEVIEAFHVPHWAPGQNHGNPFQTRYSPGPRWEVTALTTTITPPGQPVTLTWSVIPDGTIIQATGSIGDPESASNFRAWMDGLFGSEAQWRPIMRSVFDRWEQLTGLNFVEELNDDGATFIESDGIVGVRGDLRIGGKFIDGTNNVLAYNYFPQVGDMVFDTADANFSNAGNVSLFFRNVMSHEFGHGMGLAHSCPITRTKLMEPFINTGFDGPTHDDIRGAHNFYGDVFEPNDDVPTNLGTLSGAPILVGNVPTPSLVLGSNVSISVADDVDRYSFTVAGPTLLSTTLTPVGRVYGADQQSCNGFPGSCCVSDYDTSDEEGQLSLSVLSGGAVLAGSVNPLGRSAQASVYLPAAGTYEVRVQSVQPVSKVQLYSLTLEGQAQAASLGVLQTPEIMAPGAGAVVEVRGTRGSLAVPASAVQLWSRIGSSGPFSPATMALQSGTLANGVYSGSLPGAACGESVEYYVTLTPQPGTVVRQPSGAGVFVARVGSFATVLRDEFESDSGWSVDGDASAGQWVREVPVGTAAQPNADTTPDDTANPGFVCWVTGNANAGAGDGTADVDNGSTTLTSPFFDLAGVERPRLEFSLWYSNGAGAGPYNDTAFVEVRTSLSGSWQPAITLGPGGLSDDSVQPGWQKRSIDLLSLGFASPTGVQLRYRVTDTSPQSLLEAAFDDFVILGLSCSQPTCDSIDFNGDGLFPDDTDLIDFLSVLAGGPCSTNTCSDIDFNNDGLFPDDSDLLKFLEVLAGGNC